MLLIVCSEGVSFAQFRSKIRVVVTDVLGNSIPVQSLTIAGTPVNQSESTEFPYGTYTLTASAAGAAPFKATVTINQPSQIVIVAMKLGGIEGSEPPPCSIVGTTPPDGPLVLRVRTIQLFGSDEVDVPVSANRRFEVRNLDCGSYLLIAMGNTGILGTAVAKAVVLPSVVDVKFLPPGETK